MYYLLRGTAGQGTLNLPVGKATSGCWWDSSQTTRVHNHIPAVSHNSCYTINSQQFFFSSRRKFTKALSTVLPTINNQESFLSTGRKIRTALSIIAYNQLPRILPEHWQKI
jgi:hypothetical protein